MRKISILIVSLMLMFGFISCDNNTTSGGNDNTGTFRIRVTGIPSNEMAGDALIGKFPANTFTIADPLANLLAGRDTRLVHPNNNDQIGSNWYEFYLFNVEGNTTIRFVGTAGNYDIAFTGLDTGTMRVIRNRRLEVNVTNTIPFSSFVDP